MHQLNFEQATEQARLFSYCTLNGSSQEFLNQKAIRWALREDGKTDEDTVRTYVRAHHQTLSNFLI